MLLFGEYFEERVQELLDESRESTFFVFRGFEVKQIEFLVENQYSILKDKRLIKNGHLDLTVIEKNKKTLTRNLMMSEGHLVGIYEELICILSAIKDLSIAFEGKVVIINNNLFQNPVPCNLDPETISRFFDYIQSDKINEQEDMELIAQYYSDAAVLSNQYAYVFLMNVHKDLDIQVFDFFESSVLIPNNENVQTGEPILIGSDQDYILRSLVMDEKIDGVNIKKDITRDDDACKNLQMVLECLKIPYSLSETDCRAQEKEYDEEEYIPYLKRYWGEKATFRQLEFYESPSVSKNKKNISQGVLVSEIVEQCQLAQDNEMFRDIFITAPTGAGKSLLFQLPALYISEKLDLVTVVISPLIALMNDQVAQLENERGIHIATCINSSISYEARQERIEEIHSGEKSIVYLAPELLLATGIQTLLGNRKIGLFVIDEVHTVTSWGRDFRSDYWFLGDFLKMVKKQGLFFPVLCLTATAVYTGVDDVVNDTIAELDLNNPILHLGNVKRSNIKFDIVNRERDDYTEKIDSLKISLLLERLREYVKNDEKTLAYCPYTSQVEAIFNELSPEETRVIRRYYGNLRKQEKSITEMEYRKGIITALICTKAFGMGVDRSDIKHVIHFAPTGNLSDYVQEIGRAARDEGITGIAHMDFFQGDMRYVITLHGMSEMRQFQLQAMLKKIVDIYQTKKHRNLLVSPESFSHLFDEKNLEARVKNGLLMISKDLKLKYGFPVLIVRPHIMLTRIFVSVPAALQHTFEEKIGNYSKLIGKTPDKFWPNSDGTETRVISPGTVYSVRVGDLWENEYSNTSFGAFKQMFFDPTYMQDKHGTHLSPRVQVNITYHKEFKDVQKQIEIVLEAIVTILAKHKHAEKKSFEENEFISEMKAILGDASLDRNQIGLILDMFTVIVNDSTAFQQNRSTYKILQKRKQQKNGDVPEYIIMGNYGSIKWSMMRLLSQCCPGQDLLFHSYLPYTEEMPLAILPVLKLMEILNLASYDLKGGESAEIFVRVNDPEKIKRLAYGNYQNEMLREIKRRHRDSQNLMRLFFSHKMDDDVRWDFIESYFLGREDELEMYLSDESTAQEDMLEK